MPPTCCSMLVNIIQWMLTYQSIMLYKSDIQAFGLPELVRNDLESKFREIQDHHTFWKFTKDTLGDYIFSDENLLDSQGNVNLEYINTFNTTTKTRNSKGRQFVGPMRFLQKRINSKPCKRTRSNPAER